MLVVSRFVLLHAGCFPILLLGIVVVLPPIVRRYIRVLFDMLLCCVSAFDLLHMLLSSCFYRFLFLSS